MSTDVCSSSLGPDDDDICIIRRAIEDVLELRGIKDPRGERNRCALFITSYTYCE